MLNQNLNKIRPFCSGFAGPTVNIIGEILLGDIQETISKTSRDNQGGIHYKPPKHGILNTIESTHKHRTSIVREFEGQASYITRESLGDSF